METTLISEYREEVGWQSLVQTVETVRSSLPASEQIGLGILTANYGEAAAVDLYGHADRLPAAISGIDSYWLRGYGNPPPQTLITVGIPLKDLSQVFQDCQLAGHITNRYNLPNEESRSNPDVYVCKNMRYSWPQIWPKIQIFG